MKKLLLVPCLGLLIYGTRNIPVPSHSRYAGKVTLGDKFYRWFAPVNDPKIGPLYVRRISRRWKKRNGGLRMWGDNDAPKEANLFPAWVFFGFFLWAVLYLSTNPGIYALAGIGFAAGLFVYQEKARWLMLAGLVLTITAYVHQFGFNVR